MTALRTLTDALADAASGVEGYVFADRGVEIRRPYADLYQKAVRMANALGSLGLARSDVVALVISDPERFLTSLFGASMAGLTPALLHPPGPTVDLASYLTLTAGVVRTARAKVVLTTDRLIEAIEALKSTCPEPLTVVSCDRLDAPPAPVSGPRSLDDVAFVQFTSGSTSVPKGIVITHRSLAANIEAVNGATKLATSASDSAVSWLPLYHDMGLVGMALGAMYSRRPAVLLNPEAFVRRPADWLHAISKHRGTVSFAPNFAYDLCVRRVKERDLVGLDLSSWRVAGCGGEPIRAPTLEAFARKFEPFGFRESSFVPSYGLAEHVVAATLSPPGRRLRVERLSAQHVAARRIVASPVSGADHISVVGCGTALAGHRVRIVDDQGRELPELSIGEITLAGPSLMKEYQGEERLTAATIREGWLHTGDLGYLSGGELFVCGRIKDVLVLNGRKYHPQDLEWAVDDVAGVRRGRVAAFATTRPGEPDRAVIVVEASGSADAEDLEREIRRRIAAVCGLSVDEVAIVSSGAIARTTSGKIQRAATRARYERGEFTTNGTRT
jgi:fatty-acyl-CoA synthase